MDGVRGKAPVDRAAAAHALAAFSAMCAALGDHLAEADVNPVIVTQAGAVAVDALMVPRSV